VKKVFFGAEWFGISKNCTAEYFFEEIDRIIQEDYVPTFNDFIRVPSLGKGKGKENTGERAGVGAGSGGEVEIREGGGMIEVKTTINNTRLQWIDMNSQVSEKRKWLHCFDDANCLIFCVPLSDIAPTSMGDAAVPPLVEAISQFDYIANSNYFRNTPLVLFMNKFDIFQEKITQGIDLQYTFPEYTT